MTTDVRRAGRATIRMVAQHAGVSRQTVSNAINAPERVAADTLQRVLDAIDDLDYRPDQAARALSSRQSQLIGIRIGGRAHTPAASYDPMLRSLAHAARMFDYGLLVFETDDAAEDELAVIDDLIVRRAVDAIVLTDTLPTDVRPARLFQRDVPFVAFGCPWDDQVPAYSWIDVDGASGTAQAVNHLVALGHQDIAFLGWPPDEAGGDARCRGWQAAVTAHGLSAHRRLVARADDIDDGRDAVRHALASGGPTAVVCASDALAVGAARAVDDAGLRVGRDVSVTGFDDSVLAQAFRPPLTSVHQPYGEIAELIMSRLIDLIADQLDGEASDPGADGPWHMMLEPRLTIRESTGGAP